MRFSKPISAFLISVFTAGALHARDVAPHVAADPGAPAVTAENVAELDRFWPFRITMLREYTPAGASEPLPLRPAVLIRVESGETLRADFSRHGRHEVPIAATDLIEQANRVRLGVEAKMAANLVLTIGNKLLDPASEEARSFVVPRDTDLEAFLCVFADPAAEDFPAVADALRRFAGREGALTVLFPQSELRDSSVWRRLRALDWKVPFVLDRFSRLYARSILGEGVATPHWMVLTPNGRVLGRGPVSEGAGDSIAAALPAPASPDAVAASAP